VPDERIAERLAAMTSAREVAEQLLRDALDGGGTDNISIVVGRTLALRGREGLDFPPHEEVPSGGSLK
jgi:serine/threonine protein phosphatase PrpC